MSKNKLQRKRLLFVMPEASLTGSSICAYKLISYLQAHEVGYDIIVHTSKDGILVNSLLQTGITVSVACKQTELASRIAKLMCRLIYYYRFSILLLTFRPDIVYSNTIFNFGQVILGKLSGAKTIVHAHEGHNAIEKVQTRLSFSSYFTDKYIAVSHYVSSELMKSIYRPGIVIHNGIEAINLDSRSKKFNDTITAGIIGTVDRNKGQLVAVKAIEHLIKCEKLNIILKIIGATSDQYYFNEIKSYVEAHDIAEFVIFSGVITNFENIYYPLDLVIAASIDEAFPLVNLEAMAAGKLLIASNTGGNQELVEDGVTGLLFNVGDHVGLANKIYNLMMHDDLQCQIISKAKEKVNCEFKVEKMLSAIAQQIATV